MTDRAGDTKVGPVDDRPREAILAYRTNLCPCARNPATLELARSWFGQVDISDEQAIAIARVVNEALFAFELWSESHKHKREHNPALERLRRISKALHILEVELPEAIEESIQAGPHIDVARTEQLLSLVRQHSKITTLLRNDRGRARSLENNLSASLISRFEEILVSDASVKVATGAASAAMAWLTGHDKSDQAIAKARTRRKT